jgi:hypothetical protein
MRERERGPLRLRGELWLHAELRLRRVRLRKVEVTRRPSRIAPRGAAGRGTAQARPKS